MFEKYEEYDHLSMENPCFFVANRCKTIESYSITNWHDNLELQYCISGHGYVLIDGQKIDIKKGDIVVINSKAIHYISTSDSIKFHCLVIGTLFCKSALIEHNRFRFQTLINNSAIADAIKEINEIYSSDDICKSAKLQMLLLKILIELRESHTVATDILENDNKNNTVIEAIKFIKENYANKITLDMLSKNVFIDKYSLSKKFKEKTGSTIIQYINSYRCGKAMELIREGIPINEAAIKCGFNNLSFFARTFKSLTGQLPSEYKKIYNFEQHN